ncbi:MAG TPA: NfeD family protein, partial [Phycisphaerae bacterium]|nr:NfeD family protein [Phycisphaerae bacterium]
LLVLSIVSFVCSIVFAFKVSALFGLAVILAAPLVMLVAVVKGFKYLPRTFIGRRMILGRPIEREEAPPAPAPEGDAPASTGPPAEQDGELVGREGVARTDLRPSGSAQIGNRRYNVVSDGELIAPGTKVRVIEVRGNRIVVEAVDNM